MGLTICESHGRTPFVETCAHVAEKIDKGEVPDGHRFTILGNLFICDDCFEKLECRKFIILAFLPLKESLAIEDGRWEAFDTAYEAIEGRRGFCVRCLDELEHRATQPMAKN